LTRRESSVRSHSSEPISIDPNVRGYFDFYARCLDLETENVLLTTDRKQFEQWLGRRVSSSVGGAYVFLRSAKRHAILINLARIDGSKPRAIELVVAEELIHMRDHIDGDRRRHAKHGYDRIARRVAELTGASFEEIRSCLLPVSTRPLRYKYACPSCGVVIPRRRRGVWSCGKCAPRFDTRYILQLVSEEGMVHATDSPAAGRDGAPADAI